MMIDSLSHALVLCGRIIDIMHYSTCHCAFAFVCVYSGTSLFRTPLIGTAQSVLIKEVSSFHAGVGLYRNVVIGTPENVLIEVHVLIFQIRGSTICVKSIMIIFSDFMCKHMSLCRGVIINFRYHSYH